MKLILKLILALATFLELSLSSTKLDGFHVIFILRLKPAKLVATINKAQKTWTAAVYPQFESLSREDLVRMAGGKRSRLSRYQ